MQEIIITDLTRFSTKEKVCTAGINLTTGECIRPMPYILESKRQELNLHPGAILRGHLTKTQIIQPHIEDHNYTNLEHLGSCTEEQFRRALDISLKNDIRSGFDNKLPAGEKYIPKNTPPNSSIITIKIHPNRFEIIEDGYKPGKIKANLTDASGNSFRYLPITDLDFHDHAIDKNSRNELMELNAFIHQQEELYLRIGLSRPFQIGGRDGYWLQVNGIYTFPNFKKSMRGF